MVLANWHWVTPLWYLQQVEGRRPDSIIDYVEPGSEPYAETWAAEIAGALQAGHDVVATDFDEFAFAACRLRSRWETLFCTVRHRA